MKIGVSFVNWCELRKIVTVDSWLGLHAGSLLLDASVCEGESEFDVSTPHANLTFIDEANDACDEFDDEPFRVLVLPLALLIGDAFMFIFIFMALALLRYALLLFSTFTDMIHLNLQARLNELKFIQNTIHG